MFTIISAEEVTLLRGLLPEPISVFNLDAATLEVYRAKGAYSPYWTDPTLKRLFHFCRSSYNRYGMRPEVDEFDGKAAVYLVRSKYINKDNFFEEWLSIRMVPGGSKPIGGGELEIYSYHNKTIDLLVRDKFPIQDRNRFWDCIVSSSRMCGIHPYIVKDGQVQNDLSTETAKKHQYTNIAFALIHWRFNVDYPEFKYRIVTAIIRDELAIKSLGVLNKDSNRSFGPLFTPAHEYLGVKPEEIKLNRAKYAYEFPLYWFSVHQLLKLLKDLIDDGKLSNDSLVKYIGSANINEPSAMRRFGSLLSIDGPIVGSNLDGGKLRELVDKNVDDRPGLKITDAKAWNDANLSTLAAVGIYV